MDSVTHEKLIHIYRKYLIVGGMPEMVMDFINNMEIININEIYLNKAFQYKKEITENYVAN